MANQPVFYDKQFGFRTDDGIIGDPGDGNAIAVETGTCPMTSATAETRTLAIPAFGGQEITLLMEAAVGELVLTVAGTGGFNYAGNNTITFNSTGESVSLRSAYSGSAWRWQLVFNDLNGAITDQSQGLSTV